MHCRTAQQLITDAVTDSLAADQQDALRVHCDKCASCRDEWDGLQALWARMGHLAVPVPPPNLADRFANRVATQPAESPGSGWRRARGGLLAAAVAGLLMMGALGFAAGRWTAPRGGTTAIVRPTFLLLLHGDANAPGLTRSEVVAEYAGWARRLDRDGHLIDAHRLLDPVGWVEPGVEPAPTRVTTAGTGAVSGFFLVRAADMSEALGLALEGPHARYGGRIEVRPLAQ